MDPTAGTDRLQLWWSTPALEVATGGVNTWAGFGQQLRYPDPSIRSITVESVTVDGDNATVTSCIVDDGQKVDAATGVVLRDETVTARETATLRRTGQTWTISDRTETSRHEGAEPCAPA